MENKKSTLSKKLTRDTLLELLDQEDLSKISVRRLCSVAHINRGTFYNYYNNVQEVLEEIVNEIC